jgi:ATP-binding protein involved in chromosome partitioning
VRIAIPVSQGVLCPHFGHCDEFVLVDVDPEAGTVLGRQALQPPPHEPGVLPRWLKEQGADLIIAGGMGGRAQSLFAENGVRVVTGAAPEAAERLVQAYLKGELATGPNACDH